MPSDLTGAFLLAFPALFSIVNPVVGAFIFDEVTAERTEAERVLLAGRVAFYSLLVMVLALWVGPFLLSFFGISLAALRLAGGLVVALWAWGLLTAPEHREAHKQQQAADAAGDMADAFYPLTLPFTTGPGTIAVAVALGATHPPLGTRAIGFYVGITAAASAMAVVIWIAYRFAQRVTDRISLTARRTVTRLSAFLLLCIGVQILVTGATEALQPLLVPR